MADRFDDRILGEKDQYYYSSDEEDTDDGNGSGDEGAKTVRGPAEDPSEMEEFKGGAATHTGPKGVIEDWRRFKQLETEKKQEQEAERMALAKHLAMTCRSYYSQVGKELWLVYMPTLCVRPVFGKVINLTKQNFVEAIDKENKNVSVVIHIGDPAVLACEAMDGCLHCLAQEYPHVKFCSVYAADVNLSQNFIQNGLPALQIYKSGTLIGNFVRLSDQLGEDFYAGDLETFLQEHSHLPSKEEQLLVRGPHQEDSDDSDLELD
ncbi:phosducin-like protein [Acanthaster planci]|uniref:Phosducin-like protein n=1 Tax=Acanthaster planci TaxID=133434 RepID=A0A8B7XLG1_ACAPL|nr:phosducin-like protein [Acanthaster planci]